jgi:hypothetical protein
MDQRRLHTQQRVLFRTQTRLQTIKLYFKGNKSSFSQCQTVNASVFGSSGGALTYTKRCTTLGFECCFRCLRRRSARYLRSFSTGSILKTYFSMSNTTNTEITPTIANMAMYPTDRVTAALITNDLLLTSQYRPVKSLVVHSHVKFSKIGRHCPLF